MTHLTLNKLSRDEIISQSLDFPLPASYILAQPPWARPRYSPSAQGVRPLGVTVMEGIRLPSLGAWNLSRKEGFGT